MYVLYVYASKDDYTYECMIICYVSKYDYMYVCMYVWLLVYAS